MNSDNIYDILKPLTLALFLAFGAGTITAMAEDVSQPETNNAVNSAVDDNTPYVTPVETSVSTDWMSPIGAEFVKLDKTGNGLLLPYEASKDKAFNKKTFAKADTNHDGYIDLIEFTYFKTGKLPDEQAANTTNSNVNSEAPDQSQLAPN